MSSHHIVREKQEPALVITDVDDVDIALLDQLLAWSPTIIADEVSAMKLIEQGINIDIVVSPKEVFSEQDHVRVIYQTQRPFIEIALDYLIEKEYPAVNLLSKNQSIDFLASFWNKINIVIIQGRQKIFAIPSGFKKWKPKNELVEIYAPENAFTTKGLQKQDNQQYVTVSDGFYQIDFEGNYLVIAESL